MSSTLDKLNELSEKSKQTNKNIDLDVKIKLSYGATMPKYAKHGDAGLDLTATNVYRKNNKIVCETGISIEIPEGYVGLIFPRSSVAKKDLILSNCVGVIDSGYRGEIMFKFNDTFYYGNDPSGNGRYYKAGDRVGQLIIMPYPQINLIQVDELSASDRGTGGFGSSGD